MSRGKFKPCWRLQFVRIVTYITKIVATDIIDATVFRIDNADASKRDKLQRYRPTGSWAQQVSDEQKFNFLGELNMPLTLKFHVLVADAMVDCREYISQPTDGGSIWKNGVPSGPRRERYENTPHADFEFRIKK